MTLHSTRITTYWSTEEAYTALTFLDELREQLWQTYGEQITEMMQSATEQSNDERQCVINFGDDSDF